MLQSDQTIICVILIIIVLFFVWITYDLYKNPPNKNYFLLCEAGKCATNIYNGEKRCADDPSATIIYNPQFEVCNSKYRCENPLTPNAVLSNGSTNTFGICDLNVPCRCIKTQQCSYDNIVSFDFTDILSNTNNNLTNNISIKQIYLASQGFTGLPLTTPDDPTKFCQMKGNNLDRLIPRTPQCNFVNPGNPTYNEAKNCILSNPCTIGRLSFKPGSSGIPFSFKFNTYANTLASIPVGCSPDLQVADDPNYDILTKLCINNRVPVWDVRFNRLVCSF